MKYYKSFVAELQVKYAKKNELQKAQIKSSSSAQEYIRKVWPADIGHRECAMVLYLNRQNNTIGYSVLSIGGISGTMFDKRIIMQEALLCNATALIAFHNHPGGTMHPSEADKKVTREIVEAGRIMDIQLLDHIILTEDNFYSFADEGLM